jgi:hypothetical protein
VVSLALIGVGTFGGVLGLQTMGPALPAHLEHIHGFIVAVESNGIFTVQAPGYSSPLWFRVAPGAPISLDHLRRHLREHAATDIFYQDRQGKMFLAWDAD